METNEYISFHMQETVKLLYVPIHIKILIYEFYLSYLLHKTSATCLFKTGINNMYLKYVNVL